MRTTEHRTGNLQKALRTKVFETGLQMQAINMGNVVEAKDTIDRICELIGFAKLTTVEETKNVFPMLAITAPFMVNLLEQEQEKLDQQAERICEAMDSWEESLSLGQKRKLGKEMALLFNDWITNLLQYLNRQQTILDSITVDGDEENAAEKLLVVAA